MPSNPYDSMAQPSAPTMAMPSQQAMGGGMPHGSPGPYGLHPFAADLFGLGGQGGVQTQGPQQPRQQQSQAMQTQPPIDPLTQLIQNSHHAVMSVATNPFYLALSKMLAPGNPLLASKRYTNPLVQVLAGTMAQQAGSY